AGDPQPGRGLRGGRAADRVRRRLARGRGRAAVMTGVVHAPIGDVGDALTILDAGRRLYAALSRDGTYWHVVSPLQADRLDAEGNVVRAAGALSCICKG